MDRRLRPDDTFISTRPPVGGKKVRRKKGVAPKKKKSAFKKRPAKKGKILFDNPRARQARLQALSTAQLLQGAENIAGNEVGRQDGGFFAGRQQAPIQLNLGGAQQIDDRLAEAQRRMAIANLVNRNQPAPVNLRDQIQEILRENQGDLDAAEDAAGVGNLARPADEVPIFRPPPDLEPDFGDVDRFADELGEDIGIERFVGDVAEGRAQPEVDFRGRGGEAASIIEAATTPLQSESESEETLSAFNFPLGADAGLLRNPSLGFIPEPSEIGGLSREGFDPTFDDRSEIELATPTPSETSILPPILPTNNPAFEDEGERQERGKLRPLKDFAARAGGRVAQLFGRGGDEESPAAEGAFFVERPFEVSDIVGGGGGGLRVNPLEGAGAVFGSRAIPNPANSLFESDLAESIGFEYGGATGYD